MNYYKLIENDNFIGVGTSADMRRFQTKHRVLLVCDEAQAQYMNCNGILYRTGWMRPLTSDSVSYLECEVVQIEENEYQILKQSIDAGEEVSIIEEEEVIEITEEVDETVETLLSAKISEMSMRCRKSIVDGFSVTLSDGEERHFALTTQDQLNLMSAMVMVTAGETTIPYHADGELFCYFSAEDITSIYNAAMGHKASHTIYFNSLKAYINSLKEISEIAKITYGTEIPEEFRSEVMSDLLTN